MRSIGCLVRQACEVVGCLAQGLDSDVTRYGRSLPAEVLSGCGRALGGSTTGALAEYVREWREPSLGSGGPGHHAMKKTHVQPPFRRSAKGKHKARLN